MLGLYADETGQGFVWLVAISFKKVARSVVRWASPHLRELIPLGIVLYCLRSKSDNIVIVDSYVFGFSVQPRTQSRSSVIQSIDTLFRPVI